MTTSAADETGSPPASGRPVRFRRGLAVGLVIAIISVLSESVALAAVEVSPPPAPVPFRGDLNALFPPTTEAAVGAGVVITKITTTTTAAPAPAGVVPPEAPAPAAPAVTAPKATTPALATAAPTRATPPATPPPTRPASVATESVVGVLEIDTIRSPASPGFGAALPTCGTSGVEVLASTGRGPAVLATVAATSPVPTVESGPTVDARCSYRYRFAALPAAPSYRLWATDGEADATSAAPSVTAAALQAGVGPQLDLQHRS